MYTQLKTSTAKSELNQKHLALVVSNKTGRLLASATNVAHPTTFSVHAEAAAVQKLEARLRDHTIDPRALRKGATVYSMRFNRGGELRSAKPCAVCEAPLRRTWLVSCCVYS